MRAALAPKAGNKQNWRTLGVEALERLRAEQVDLAAAVDARLAVWREYRRLVVGAVAAGFVLDGAHQRAAAGTLEFHDLLVLARRLLTRHPGARRILHHRYQRVLLDEFQDTDPIQLDLADPADGRARRRTRGRPPAPAAPRPAVRRR